MTYLVLEQAEKTFFTSPRSLFNLDAYPKPYVVTVTLQGLLKKYKAQYQQVTEHFSFFQFFQTEMNIQDRAMARRVFQIFFSQLMPSHSGTVLFPDFSEFFEKYTPFLLKQALREVFLVVARSQGPLRNLISTTESQDQIAKLLLNLQYNALKSDEKNQVLISLFLKYQIPQSMIDYEITLFRALMDDIFCDLSKRNCILRAIRDWQTYSGEQKILFLQEFVAWHSFAFGTSVPKVVEVDLDPAFCGFTVRDKQIKVASCDLQTKPPVELMLYCLHENTCNYHVHLCQDFEVASKRIPSQLSGFYKELSHIKAVRQYIRNLYLSACHYRRKEQGLEFYYLQPFKFHAFTHEFLFATLFLEEFTKLDSSQALYRYQLTGSLIYRQVADCLDQVWNLVGSYMQELMYESFSLEDVREKFMPRYITFLEVYCGRDSKDPSLLKAFKELEAYGNAYQKNLQEAGVKRELSLKTSCEERIERDIETVLAE